MFTAWGSSMKRSRQALALFTLAVMCAVLATAIPATAVTLYVSTSGEGGGDIWRIDSDGEGGFPATHVISTGLTRLGAIAFGPNGGLYAMSGGAVGPAQLYVITGLDEEPSMALVGDVGAVEGIEPVSGVDGMRFDRHGRLLGGGWNVPALGPAVPGHARFVIIDPATALVTTTVLMSGTGTPSAAGLAFEPGGPLSARERMQLIAARTS